MAKNNRIYNFSLSEEAKSKLKIELSNFKADSNHPVSDSSIIREDEPDDTGKK
jgi:hypothetical protein